MNGGFMTKQSEFEHKMAAIIKKKEAIIGKLNTLLQQYKKLDAEADRLEDDEFARTGSFSTTLSVSVIITEQDLLQDLVSRTEGKNISPDKPNLN